MIKIARVFYRKRYEKTASPPFEKENAELNFLQQTKQPTDCHSQRWEKDSHEINDKP